MMNLVRTLMALLLLTFTSGCRCAARTLPTHRCKTA